MVHPRLLDVAIREFGRKGLEGTSTRGIAAAAGTAMSSITYHYGGKEGLYAAAADYIDGQLAEQMASVTDAPLPDDPGEARAGLHRLIDQLAVKFLGDADEDWSFFIMHEQMRPGEAFDRFYRGAMGRMAQRLVALIAVATGADEAEARIVALTLFGQVVMWRSSRAMVDRVLHAPIDDDRQAAIRRRIARNTDSILDRLIADQADQQEPQ